MIRTAPIIKTFFQRTGYAKNATRSISFLAKYCDDNNSSA
jgi:hypothetical protein